MHTVRRLSAVRLFAIAATVVASAFWHPATGFAAEAAAPSADAPPASAACGSEANPCLTPAIATLDKAGNIVSEEPGTPATAAAAGTRANNSSISWRFNNRSGVKVLYRFYSKSRNWVWPSNNKAFVLPNGQNQRNDITCKRGEYVCYGAWVSNNPNFFWGVGKSGNRPCANCCFTCNGVTTPIYVLK
jgi:hypothetical protein